MCDVSKSGGGGGGGGGGGSPKKRPYVSHRQNRINILIKFDLVISFDATMLGKFCM
jgi:hypothetical protein